MVVVEGVLTLVRAMAWRGYGWGDVEALLADPRFPLAGALRADHENRASLKRAFHLALAKRPPAYAPRMPYGIRRILEVPAPNLGDPRRYVVRCGPRRAPIEVEVAYDVLISRLPLPSGARRPPRDRPVPGHLRGVERGPPRGAPRPADPRTSETRRRGVEAAHGADLRVRRDGHPVEPDPPGRWEPAPVAPPAGWVRRVPAEAPARLRGCHARHSRGARRPGGSGPGERRREPRPDEVRNAVPAVLAADSA